MFNRFAKIGAVILLALSTTACMSTGGMNQNNSCSGMKSTVGALLGGVAGGFGGAQFGKGNGKTAMTVLGALAGAGMGSSVGNSLDNSDCMYQQQQNGYQNSMQGRGPSQYSNNPLLTGKY